MSSKDDKVTLRGRKPLDFRPEEIVTVDDARLVAWSIGYRITSIRAKKVIKRVREAYVIYCLQRQRMFAAGSASMSGPSQMFGGGSAPIGAVLGAKEVGSFPDKDLDAEPLYATMGHDGEDLTSSDDSDIEVTDCEMAIQNTPRRSERPPAPAQNKRKKTSPHSEVLVPEGGLLKLDLAIGGLKAWCNNKAQKKQASMDQLLVIVRDLTMASQDIRVRDGFLQGMVDSQEQLTRLIKAEVSSALESAAGPTRDFGGSYANVARGPPPIKV